MHSVADGQKHEGIERGQPSQGEFDVVACMMMVMMMMMMMMMKAEVIDRL